MLDWKGTKRTALLVGAVVLAILIGTGVVAAAQSHLAPFTSSNSAGRTQTSAHGDHDPTQTGQPEQGEDKKLTGTILSIDTTGQTFVLTPDDGSAAATIAFDANTNVEKEDGANPLAVGAHVRVEVIQRADGSLYAQEIKLVSDGHGDGDGNGGGSDDGGSDGHGGSGSGGSNGGSGHGGDGGGSDDGGSGH